MSAPQRRAYVSDNYERFYTQHNHNKRCAKCGKPNLLWLERCNFCNTLLLEDFIQSTEPDDCVEAALTGKYHGRDVLHKTWEAVVVSWSTCGRDRC